MFPHYSETCGCRQCRSVRVSEGRPSAPIRRQHARSAAEAARARADNEPAHPEPSHPAAEHVASSREIAAALAQRPTSD